MKFRALLPILVTDDVIGAHMLEAGAIVESDEDLAGPDHMTVVPPGVSLVPIYERVEEAV